ncbi:MAG: DUF58 domain-containing protein [Planctomycetota bacterium JB042]
MEERDVGLAELLAEVRRIEVQSDRLVNGLLAGAYRSVFRGAGVEFDEVREYQEGDDPRAVDWNVTARVGRPFVKTYVDERDLTVLFLLDVSRSMRAGFGPWSARGAAARVCACLALSAARSHDKVGLVAFADGVERIVPPRQGTPHALRIVRDCLALPDGRGRTDLAPALERAARMVRRHAVVFVVSDFLFDGFGSTLAASARRHDVVAVRLLLPELEPPDLGLLRGRDPESGRATVVDWGSAKVRSAYAARVEAWRAGHDRELARAGVDVIDVPVPRHEGESVARPLVDFFRMRERRGTKR